MLRKLIKHELRATGRVMGPMLGLTLLAAIGGNFAVHGLLETRNSFLDILGSFLLTAFVATIAASFIVSFALMIRRFYQNLLRDEGYLMMTLPVSVHAHVLSKLFVSLLWAAATVITMGIAMCILVFELEFANVILRDLGELFAQLEFSGLRLMDFAGHAVILMIEMILLLAIADSCLCLQIYAAIAIGHSFTHHKGLLSFMAYFGLSIAWHILQTGMLYMLNLLAPNGLSFGLHNLSPYAATHLNMLALMAALLIPTALWYSITTYFLGNRLNLG